MSMWCAGVTDVGLRAEWLRFELSMISSVRIDGRVDAVGEGGRKVWGETYKPWHARGKRWVR